MTIQRRLGRCARCAAFLAPGGAACPHCRWTAPAWLKCAIGVASGAAMSMTLSACYGGACAGQGCYEPEPYEPHEATTCTDPALDEDGDGVCEEDAPLTAPADQP